MRGYSPQQGWGRAGQTLAVRAGLGALAAEPSAPGGTPALAPLQTVPTEELHSIRGELSQIKAQVDRLLENLEHMGQQRDQLPTGGPGHIPGKFQLFPLRRVPGGGTWGPALGCLQGSFLPSQGVLSPTPSACSRGLETPWLLGCSMNPPTQQLPRGRAVSQPMPILSS